MAVPHWFWSDTEPWYTFRNRLVPHILRALHAAVMCTVRITTSGLGRAHPYLSGAESERGALFVVWHDALLVPMHLVRHKKMCVMVSRSRSGQIAAALWRLHGFPVVWGSTRQRAGIAALREALGHLRAGQSVGLAPDGPLGPRHQAHPGVVYLASQCAAAIMPIGVAASAAWRLPTWDRHLIPRPFSRVHLHVGAPIEVPPKVARDQIPRWQNIIRDSLERAEATARQNLAASGDAS
ncbi:MAG TPA: lysophospholipid acyltransferase family protein [Abditibacteriaceae bacterium]|nr:lysophospholipid acyltransferase family protein [Abditibacteriaceae bacterium]